MFTLHKTVAGIQQSKERTEEESNVGDMTDESFQLLAGNARTTRHEVTSANHFAQPFPRWPYEAPLPVNVNS